jgi:hypothetical protein
MQTLLFRVFIVVAVLLGAGCRLQQRDSVRASVADADDCAHGATLRVGPGGDFTRITDALTHARRIRLEARELEQARRPICIDVAAGTYVGTFAPDVLAVNPQYEAFPLVIDVPGIELRGATTLALDDHDRPVAVRADATTLIAEPPAVGNQPYVLVTTTERRNAESVVRSSGNAARIEGFALRFARCGSGHACNADGDCPAGDSCELVRQGTGIWTQLVRDYSIRGNAITGAGSFAIEHIASSGNTIRNLLTRNFPAGISYIGPAPGPSKIWQNTSTDNGGGMVVVCAGGAFTLPTLAHEGDLSVVPRPVDGSMNRTDVEINGNDFSHDPGFGLRTLMFGFVPLPPGLAECRVTALRNRITDNAIGVVVDAGFPYQTRDGVHVDTAWTARFSGRFEGNTIEGSAENAVVTLTRATSTRDCRELDPEQETSFRFLRNSTYTISTDDGFATACYDNRELDPRSGQQLGNNLQINGEPRTGLTCKQVVACN